MPGLTYEDARRMFIYCPSTGKLFWRINRRTGEYHNILVAKAMTEAGIETRSRNGLVKYLLIKTGGRMYQAHRIAWLLLMGNWPSGIIDHIDGDGMNNRIENLRDVQASENNKNKRRSRNNKSGCTGVYWVGSRNKWRASITVDGRFKHLGFFDNKEAASISASEARSRMGFTERHGL